MAEQLLHRSEVGTAFEQVRSVCVPEGVRVEGPPVGQRMALEDPTCVARGERITPSVQEDHIAGRRGIREDRTTAVEPGRERVGGRLPHRDAPDLGPLAHHGDQRAVAPPADLDVVAAQPAALGDAQARAVEHLEHREVAQDHRGGDRVGFVVCSGQGGLLDLRGHDVEEVGGLVGADHTREAVRTLGGAQAAPRVDLDDPVAAQPAQVGAHRGGLAGDRRAGEAACVEVGEVATQRAPVDVDGRRAAAALGPGDELAHVVGVGGPGVRAHRHERSDEVVGRPGAGGGLRRHHPTLALLRPGAGHP